MTIARLGEPAQHFTLAFDASDRVTAAIRDDGRTTTYVYDEELATTTIDTASGAVRGVIHYDTAGRELDESWGGTDPVADHRETVFDYAGDRLAAITFRAGEPLAPVEVQLPRYTCD
jgi:YD repeat-containing protein